MKTNSCFFPLGKVTGNMIVVWESNSPESGLVQIYMKLKSSYFHDAECLSFPLFSLVTLAGIQPLTNPKPNPFTHPRHLVDPVQYNNIFVALLLTTRKQGNIISKKRNKQIAH